MSAFNDRMAAIAKQRARDQEGVRLKRIAADPYHVLGHPEGAHPPLGKQWDNVGKRYVPKEDKSWR